MTKEEIKIEAERYYTNRLNETGFELFDNERKMQISVMVSFAKLIANQESAKAVAKRDKEIKEWINANKFKSNDHGIVIYPDHLITFLSTPTSAEIAQVEPEKVSDNFKINIIPELSRGELEERCIEMYERLHNQIDSIPIREIEKLKDRYERMLMLLQMRNIKNSKLGEYQIFISELDNILQSIKPKP
jgi:hypothetical protein